MSLTPELKFPVVIERRSHPFPFRTRQLSSASPMILRGQLRGKVGRRRDNMKGPRGNSRAFSFCVSPPPPLYFPHSQHPVPQPNMITSAVADVLRHLSEYARDARAIGAIVPSSRTLADRVASTLPSLRRNEVVVELG